jgi:hypothetical protein
MAKLFRGSDLCLCNVIDNFRDRPLGRGRRSAGGGLVDPSIADSNASTAARTRARIFSGVILSARAVR